MTRMTSEEAWSIIEPPRVALQRILDGALPVAFGDTSTVGWPSTRRGCASGASRCGPAI